MKILKISNNYYMEPNLDIETQQKEIKEILNKLHNIKLKLSDMTNNKTTPKHLSRSEIRMCDDFYFGLDNISYALKKIIKQINNEDDEEEEEEEEEDEEEEEEDLTYILK